MSHIRAIFFDLDHTLWDYEVNSRDTLSERFREHYLSSLLGCTTDDFLKTFERVNHKLWDQYNHHLIDRDTIRKRRFSTIFSEYGVTNDPLSLEISDQYISRCPTKTHLLPHALETLDYLHKTYPLHILSNGFDDVQAIKLESAGIRSYFGEVITSETSGHRKPSREIFHFACERIGMQQGNCLMIGDNFHADILGAMDAELRAMYFNPLGVRQTRRPHWEIRCLSEIRNLL